MAKCGQCKKPATGNRTVIECSKCHKCYHQCCQHIPAAVWSWFIETSHVYVCSTCRNPHQKKTKPTSKDTEETDDTDQHPPDSAKKSSSNIIISNEEQSTPSSSVWQTVIRGAVRKEFARERRKREIVVAGLTLPMDEKSIGDPVRMHGSGHSQLCRFIERAFGSSYDRHNFKDAHCFEWQFIGPKLPDKPRLILMRFKYSYIADDLRRISRKLKSSKDYCQVYIRESLSKEERIEKGKQRQLRKAQNKPSD